MLKFLEQVPVDPADAAAQPFRLPVQWVNRPHADFRGYAGTVGGGVIRPGDRLRIQPSGRVARIVSADGDLSEAVAGQSITLTLSDEIDISRGDLLAAVAAPAAVADRLTATLVWMGEQPLQPGQRYLMKLGTASAVATVTALHYQVDVNTRECTPTLTLNGTGLAELALDRPVAFNPYRDTGGFILIDRIGNDTVAAGLIEGAVF